MNVREIGDATNWFQEAKPILMQQFEWMRSMIRNYSHDSNETLRTYWTHVGYIVAQFDGLYDGYKAVAQPDWVTNSLKCVIFTAKAVMFFIQFYSVFAP